MSKRIKKVIIEIPHRISGFFEIVDKIKDIDIQDPLKIGSRGAGFCLDAKGKTEIISQVLDNYKALEIEIFINGKRLDKKAETTYFIVEYIKKYVKESFKIRINHTFDLPVGCGYGASGSGALGTVFGLDYILNLKLSYQEKIKIAHIAEVVNRTGLGTVCGQLGGGLGILKEPGYPCVYERINVPKDLRIICSSFGVIHTKSILTSEALKKKINKAGKRALPKLIADMSIHTFAKASIDFVKETEIMELLNLTKTKELMNELNKLDIIGASMNQLGRSVFTIFKNEKEKDIYEVIKSFEPEVQTFNTTINNKKTTIFRKIKKNMR